MARMGWLRLIIGVVCAQGAWAQTTIKRDGQWRAAPPLGAGGNVATGNNRSTNLTMTGEVVRATEVSKWSLNGRLLYAAAQGDITSDNQVLSSQYDKDLTQAWWRRGTSPPYAPTEPYMNVSPHTALVAEPLAASTDSSAHPDRSVDRRVSSNNWPPSLHTHYRCFNTTTQPSAPVPRIGTQALAVPVLDAHHHRS